MFANGEFDLDEDFLNDLSQRESQYFSQKISSDEERPAKRFKIDEDSSERSDSKPASKIDKEVSLVQNITDIGGKTIIRKNLILDRLKRNGIITARPHLHESAVKNDNRTVNLEKSNSAQESFPHPTNNESRKILVLEKLKKNNIESISTCSPRPDAKRCLTGISNGISNKSKSDLGETIANCPLKLGTTHNKPVALVRQFPGPAGLLPHSTGGVNRTLIGESTCFDNSNVGTEVDAIADSSMISKYCSQNTKNLFSEGAWQLLMSDLSPDFLSGHDISTVKQKVWTNSYRNNKVPFLAGMVQRVDLTSLDPLVILKDCTGTIEGTICKDILVEYPQALDIGVVLLLADVGLLAIGSYLKKCHVIVTLKNIINVYTAKSRVLSIAEMDGRLKNLYKTSNPPDPDVNRVPNGSFSLNSKIQCGPNMEQILVTKNTNRQLSFSNLKNDNNLYSRSDYTCRTIVAKERSAITNKHTNSEESQNSVLKCANSSANNYENLNSLRTHTNPSQHIHHISNKPAFDSGGFEDLDDDFAASFLDIDDDPVSKATRNLVPPTNSKTETHIASDKNTVVSKESSALSVTNSNVNLSQETNRCIPQVTNVWHQRTKKTEVISRKPTIASKCNISDTKHKLSVFRSKTELTPESCENLDGASSEKNHEQNQNRIESSFTSALLLDEENDSDEELLSQLDV